MPRVAGRYLLAVESYEGGVQECVHNAVRVRQSCVVCKQRRELAAVAVHRPRHFDLLDEETCAVPVIGEGDGGSKR